MHASPLARDFVVGPAEIRIEFADIDRHARLVVLIGLVVLVVLVVPIVLVVAPVQIKFLCLPGFSVFRKTVRIGCNLECFLCDDAGYLMMPVPVSRRASKTGNDDFRTKIANDPYIIAED